MKVIDQTKICENYGGKWVILDNSRTKVLSADVKLDQAIAKYRKKYGEKEIPMSFKVPTKILPYVGC